MGGVYMGIFVSSKHRIGVFFFAQGSNRGFGTYQKPPRTYLVRRRPVRVDWWWLESHPRPGTSPKWWQNSREITQNDNFLGFVGISSLETGQLCNTEYIWSNNCQTVEEVFEMKHVALIVFGSNIFRAASGGLLTTSNPRLVFGQKIPSQSHLKKSLL